MELSMYAYLIIYEASYLTSFKFFLFRVKLKRTNSYLVSHSYISLLVLVVFSRLSYVHFVFSTAFLFTVLLDTHCSIMGQYRTLSVWTGCPASSSGSPETNGSRKSPINGGISQTGLFSSTFPGIFLLCRQYRRVCAYFRNGPACYE